MRSLMLATAAVLALALQAASAAQVLYYEVPRGAHPHDVAPAPDGSIWYTAQAQAALGILDPRTGKTTHVALGKDAMPHGVIAGPDVLPNFDDCEHAAHFDRAELALARHHGQCVLWQCHAHCGHVLHFRHAILAHRHVHVIRQKLRDLRRCALLANPQHVWDFMTHRSHRVMRLVAMKCPITFDIGDRPSFASSTSCMSPWQSVQVAGFFFVSA